MATFTRRFAFLIPISFLSWFLFIEYFLKKPYDFAKGTLQNDNPSMNTSSIIEIHIKYQKYNIESS